MDGVRVSSRGAFVKLGSVELGPKCEGDTSPGHWHEMMKVPRRPVAQWHPLVQNPTIHPIRSQFYKLYFEMTLNSEIHQLVETWRQFEVHFYAKQFKFCNERSSRSRKKFNFCYTTLNIVDQQRGSEKSQKLQNFKKLRHFFVIEKKHSHFEESLLYTR